MRAPAAGERGERAVAVVNLSLLTDLDDFPVKIGMRVEMVTRKVRYDSDERGVIVYWYKFRPVAGQMPS